jgi:hypothetical protein
MAVRAILLASITAILVAPPAAGSEQVVKAQVCGASDCYTFDRHNSGGKLALFAVVGKRVSPPTHGGPWYRLRITFGGEGAARRTVTSAYLPGADRIRRPTGRGGHGWVEVIDDLRPVMHFVSDRLESLPPSTLPGRVAPPAGAEQQDGRLDRPAVIAVLVFAGGLLVLLMRKRLSGSYLAPIRARRSESPRGSR